VVAHRAGHDGGDAGGRRHTRLGMVVGEPGQDGATRCCGCGRAWSKEHGKSQLAGDVKLILSPCPLESVLLKSPCVMLP
jgi:hypothetical protein